MDEGRNGDLAIGSDGLDQTAIVDENADVIAITRQHIDAAHLFALNYSNRRIRRHLHDLARAT